MKFIMISVFLISSFILSISFYLSRCIWRPCKGPPKTKVFTTREEIRLLLDPPLIGIEALLHHRALPNVRLLHAFGITNSTFTSKSIGIHDQFRRHAVARLRNLDSPKKWQTIGGVTKDAADFYLPSDLMSGDYSAYMQAVVLVTVLAAFFDETISFPERSHIRFVTEGINELWIASKSPTFRPVSPILAQVNQHLHSWLPDDPADPFRGNPLELILPAYETLWRLVAHTFTYVEDTPSYARLFLDFFDNPTLRQFAMPGISDGPSAQEFLKEVLRLHPPTKRIKRSRDIPSWIPVCIRRLIVKENPTCSTIVSADVEALQRSSVWGPLPHEFDAMRHRASTDAQKECLIPFGLGPLKCVASSLAPRLAGMIVAGMVIRDDIELTRGEGLGSREGWGGWKVSRKF